MKLNYLHLNCYMKLKVVFVSLLRVRMKKVLFLNDFLDLNASLSIKFCIQKKISVNDLINIIHSKSFI